MERQIEFGNLLFGFEQRNKYILSNPCGETLGYLLERERSLSQILLRQVTKLHRPFIVDIFDKDNNYLFKLQRKFSFINSKLNTWNEINNEKDYLVGSSIQKWHPWRRKYELFSTDQNKGNNELIQFGVIDSPFLSFDFPVKDENNKIIASVERNWVGLGREMFTDTGVYIIRFDSQRSFNNIYTSEALSSKVLNLNQRAILLSNAVSIDFDYFSRHSRDASNGGFMSMSNYE